MASTGSGAKRVALVTGISGQLGSLMADFLLGKGYEVHGLVRDLDTALRRPYAASYKSATLHEISLQDSEGLTSLLSSIRPDEIYNLAAEANVGASWGIPIETAETNGLGVLRILEGMRSAGLASSTRLLQAGTSELFGQSKSAVLNEETPLAPRSPYATSKAFAHWSVKQYRDMYGMFATNAILFNHESDRRGHGYSTSKITRGVAAVLNGTSPCLHIGNPDLQRDWGYAQDGVSGMWLALQHDKADDFCFCTGSAHTLRQFVEEAFRTGGVEVGWSGEGIECIGRNTTTADVVVRVDAAAYNMPTNNQCGDPSKAERELGWRRQGSFEDVIAEMMKHAMDVVSDGPC